MRKVSARLYFLIHSLIFFSFVFHHLYFHSLNFSNASALLHFFFFCVSIILHCCLGDILIKINLSGCFPSQTVTTAAIQTRKERERVWKLRYSVYGVHIYLFIWKHFRQNTFRRKFDVWTLDEAEKLSCNFLQQQQGSSMKMSGATMVQPSPDNNWKKRLSSSVGGGSPVTGRLWVQFLTKALLPRAPTILPLFYIFYFTLLNFFIIWIALQVGRWFLCSLHVVPVSALVLSEFGIPIINVKSTKKDIKNDSVNPEWLEKSCSNTAMCFVSSSPAGTSSDLTTSDGRMCLFPLQNWSPWQRVVTWLHPWCRVPSMHMDVACVRAVI